MAAAIEIEGLCKEYRGARRHRTRAVDDLHLDVQAGGVFGFLGPNGSGKTTTLRCVMGLVRPSAGRVRVLGAEVPHGLPSVISRIGSVIESPAMFPTMSGRENLVLLGALDGIGPRRVDEVLALVGLAERGDDAVRRYSLGMRQRLGIGAALLRDPELLILDEPANGLDPGGIREIRELLRLLGAEGRTVLVSSHILSEVEHTCDAVAILRKGRCVAAGRVEAVLADGDDTLIVGLDDLDAGLVALRCAGLDGHRDGDVLVVPGAAEDPARVTQILASHDLWVTTLRRREHNLEDQFLALTEESFA
jgi:ABC-2 type transport system ATP-binding protein